MSLKESLLRGIYGFEKPSAMQQRAIPCIKDPESYFGIG
uniref:RNA helicase n=1 Tax=Xenopus laevis TaxID=8355 RepID=Q32N29_XENLA|nr:Unknown (protein for MGC:132349) [Xenopus laevis]